VDLVLLPLEAGRCAVVSGTRGRAVVSQHASGISYTMDHGDPLGIGGAMHNLDRAAAWDITRGTDYPDSLVQIAALAASSRCGDIVLSATRGWDFRERYEPIPHASSHGALHRDHMCVPLLIDRPPAYRPRRTTDTFASALRVLGIAAPSVLDGESFF
jgi:hypothetical protein